MVLYVLKKAKFICIYLCFVFLLAACSEGGSTAVSPQTPTPYPTPIVPEKPVYTAQRGTVVDSLEFTGRVSPVLEQELFFKTDGFVASLSIARGDRVQAGDVLAELEINDLENQLAQKELALQTAETTLSKADQDRLDQLAEARINLEKIELQLEQGQASGNSAAVTGGQINLRRAEQRVVDAEYELQKSQDRPWEPEALRKQYEAALQQAQDGLRVARAQYSDALVGSGSSRYTFQLLEKDLELAQLKVSRLDRGVDPLLALNVENAQLGIDDIQRRIADARLIAPFSGQVLSISIRPGDNVQAFSTVLVLAEPDSLEITAELGSEDLSQMSVNQPAIITLRNRPEESFSGFVRQLPYPYGGGTVASDDGETAVRITFDQEINLELGELASVVIILQQKEDVLWLPPAALRSFQGRDFIVIQQETSQQRVDIRLGIQSEERVEILEGVEDGQIIIGE